MTQREIPIASKHNDHTLVLSLAEFADSRLAAAFLIIVKSVLKDGQPLRASDDVDSVLKAFGGAALDAAARSQQTPTPFAPPPATFSLSDVSYAVGVLVGGLARLLRPQVASSDSEVWVTIAERTLFLRLLALNL